MIKLIDIAKKHKTDKCDKYHVFRPTGHTYIDIYEAYFESVRQKELNLLEIGVHKGRSLRMWRDYFPQSRIFGLDINPNTFFQEERIDITIGSQADPQVLDKLCQKVDCFDIIVDDGSHVNHMTIDSFNYLFKKIRSGGWYVVEDLACSYENANPQWPGMVHNVDRDFSNKREEIENWFCPLIREMDHSQGEIETIQFWSMMAFIKKT